MRLASLLSTLVLMAATGSAGADTLDMPASETEPQAAESGVSLNVPARGMSMRQVETRFGSPATKFDPVGDPPISRWVYEPYTVYFEKQYVIHAVLNR